MKGNLTSLLNRRVELWGNDVKTTNELGEVDYITGKIKDLYVGIIPQTGNVMKSTADTILSNVTTKFICRYQSGKDITTDMWLMYAGKRHDIKYILDPYAKHETLEIFCEEVIG